MSRLARFVVAVAVWLLALAAPAAAKSFRLERLQVEATVTPAAAMDVIEHVTYRFEGSFSRATRTIPAGSYYTVQGVRVTENGQPLPVSGTANDFAWAFSASDERRTFDISYRVVGAVRAGPDVGELYWKWVGTDHPGFGSVRVRLQTPATEGVRAWAHGPLNGVVHIDGGTVTFDAQPVPARTFVEGRVAIPRAVFTVAPSGPARLPTILREERGFAEQANRARADARAHERSLRRRARVAAVVAPVVALIGWVAFFMIWRRWGQEPAPQDVGEYVRDVPDEPPAVVDAILGFGGVDSGAFSATVMDLAQRGYLDIGEERHDRLIGHDRVTWTFHRKKPPDDGLRPYERRVLDRLFDDGDNSSQEELVAWARSHRSAAQSFWKDFQQDARAAAEDGYIEQARGVPFALNVLAGLVVLAVAVLCIFATAAPERASTAAVVVAAVAAVSGVVQLAATRALRRRTPLGAQRAAEFRALARYLRDFSELDDAPVGHLVLWERYLVYAVALGVSHELVRGLALRVPEAVRDPAFAGWYVASTTDGARLDSIGSFAHGFGAAAVSAFSPSSSSSGGGGGFSGGGGGGGGGGGFGAS